MPSPSVPPSFDSLFDRLRGMDTLRWFAEPVDPVKFNLPDYFEVIKRPMDFGTVARKRAAGEYESDLEALADVLQTIQNALTYNKRNTPVYKLAALMMDQCKAFERGESGFVASRKNKAPRTSTPGSAGAGGGGGGKKAKLSPSGVVTRRKDAAAGGGDQSDEDEDGVLDAVDPKNMVHAVYPILPPPPAQPAQQQACALAFEPSPTSDLHRVALIANVPIRDLALPGLLEIVPKGASTLPARPLPFVSGDVEVFAPPTAEDMHYLKVAYNRVVGDAIAASLVRGPESMPETDEPTFTGFAQQLSVKEICQVTVPPQDAFLAFQSFATAEQKRRFMESLREGSPQMWVAIPTHSHAKRTLGVTAIRAYIPSRDMNCVVAEPHLICIDGTTLTVKGVVRMERRERAEKAS